MHKNIKITPPVTLQAMIVVVAFGLLEVAVEFSGEDERVVSSVKETEVESTVGLL